MFLSVFNDFNEMMCTYYYLHWISDLSVRTENWLKNMAGAGGGLFPLELHDDNPPSDPLFGSDEEPAEVRLMTW